LVFVAFATARDWLPVLILVPAAIFAAKVALSETAPSPTALARDFAVFAAAALVFFWLVLRITQKRRG
jgi:predicted cobalt transporter CbtA